MSQFGPPLVAGEVEGVISFVKARGKEKQERKFSVSIEELKPFLVGVKEDSHYLNRVRWMMAQQLEDAGITLEFPDGINYIFILNESIDLTPSGEIVVPPKVVEGGNLPHRKDITETNWGTDFIPPHYFGRLVERCNAGVNIVLVGPKGCGKSRSAEEVFKKIGLFYIRFAMGEVRDPVELLGTKEIVNINGVSVTKYVGGLLTEAIYNGWGIIMDEMDSVAPSVAMTFQKILEEGTSLTICTENGVETIPKHKTFRIICTANSWGYGDETGNYAGTRNQNRSTWDRLNFKRDCHYDAVIEKQLVRRFLPEAVIDALYHTGGTAAEDGIIIKIRRAIKEETLDDELSFRPILTFAKAYEVMGWNEGMYYFLNEFRPENNETLSKIITDHLGWEFIPSDNNYSSTEPNFIKNFKEKLTEKGFIR